MYKRQQEAVRIDKLISEALPQISRSYAQKLLEKQLVQVEGKPVKSNYKTKPGQQIVVTVPPPQPLSLIHI